MKIIIEVGPRILGSIASTIDMREDPDKYKEIIESAWAKEIHEFANTAVSSAYSLEGFEFQDEYLFWEVTPRMRAVVGQVLGDEQITHIGHLLSGCEGYPFVYAYSREAFEELAAKLKANYEEIAKQNS